MCLNKSRWDSSIPSYFRLKKCRIQVRLAARGSSSAKKLGRRGIEMELQNLKLYLENKWIIEENEKLRKRALVLDQENRALLSKLKKKSSLLDDNM